MREKLQVMNTLIAPGNYDLSVIGIPEKLNDKANSRKWKFGIIVNGKIVREITLFLPPWEAKGLIVELGGILTGNYVEWDDELVDGKCINCDISHVEYESKKEVGKIKTKYAISNITATIPF